MHDEIAAYNRASYTRQEYSRFRDLAQLDFHPALHVGDIAPDFTVTDLEGRSVRLSDFQGKKNVLFEFGCLTAPIFISDLPALNRLHRTFAEKDVQVLVIYVREAHPGEHYEAHSSLEQKTRYARDLQRLEGVEPPIFVDSLAGEAHHLYGVWPSPVWIVNKEGRIVHKSLWLVADQVELVLQHLVRAEEIKAQGLRTRWVYAETWTELGVTRSVHERVLSRAGPRARREVSEVIGHDPVTRELR